MADGFDPAPLEQAGWPPERLMPAGALTRLTGLVLLLVALAAAFA